MKADFKTRSKSQLFPLYVIEYLKKQVVIEELPKYSNIFEVLRNNSIIKVIKVKCKHWIDFWIHEIIPKGGQLEENLHLIFLTYFIF